MSETITVLDHTASFEQVEELLFAEKFGNINRRKFEAETSKKIGHLFAELQRGDIRLVFDPNSNKVLRSVQSVLVELYDLLRQVCWCSIARAVPREILTDGSVKIEWLIIWNIISAAIRETRKKGAHIDETVTNALWQELKFVVSEDDILFQKMKGGMYLEKTIRYNSTVYAYLLTQNTYTVHALITKRFYPKRPQRRRIVVCDRGDSADSDPREWVKNYLVAVPFENFPFDEEMKLYLTLFENSKQMS